MRKSSILTVSSAGVQRTIFSFTRVLFKLDKYLPFRDKVSHGTDDPAHDASLGGAQYEFLQLVSRNRRRGRPTDFIASTTHSGMPASTMSPARTSIWIMRDAARSAQLAVDR